MVIGNIHHETIVHCIISDHLYDFNDNHLQLVAPCDITELILTVFDLIEFLLSGTKLAINKL